MRAPVLAAAFLALTAPSFAATLHVCPDGSGEYPHLRAAVDAAVDGDVIELCDGVFEGLDNVEIDTGAKSLTIRSLHGMEATTIFASIWDPVYSEYHPYRGFIVGAASVRIEGITIERAGHYVGVRQLGDGAAIACVGGSLTLERVRVVGWHIRQARRGAGVFLQNGSVGAFDCVFDGCRATEHGGAIYAESSWIDIQHCTFQHCGSCWESVLWFDSGGDIADCIFEQSSSLECDNGPTGNVLRIPSGAATVRRCRFSDNVARSGGCAQVWPGATLLLEDCLIEGAIGESGGALSSSGNLTVRNCVFRNNWCAWAGGAVTGRGLITLEGCVFHDNACFQPATHGGAGAITIWDPATLVIRSCTLFRNGLSGGSAIALGEGSHLIVENSVLAFGGGAGSGIGPVHCRGPLAELAVHCTAIFGNAGGDWIGCLTGLEGANGNLLVDPAFCDTTSIDLRLRADSPCAPANSGGCGLVGALDVGCGPTALEASSWGSIKALYR